MTDFSQLLCSEKYKIIVSLNTLTLTTRRSSSPSDPINKTPITCILKVVLPGRWSGDFGRICVFPVQLLSLPLVSFARARCARFPAVKQLFSFLYTLCEQQSQFCCQTFCVLPRVRVTPGQIHPRQGDLNDLNKMHFKFV